MGLRKNMELLLPATVVPRPNSNGRMRESRYSEPSWNLVVVGSELTETLCAAACHNPNVTLTTRVQEATSGTLGAGNPAAAVVPPGIAQVA